MWQHDLHQKVTPMDLSPALIDKSTVANQVINTGNVAGLKQQNVSSGGTIKNFLSAIKEFAANIAATGEDIVHGTIKNYKTRQQDNEGRNLYAGGVSLAIKGNDQEKYLYRAIAEGYALLSGMELAIELGIRYEGPTPESNRELAGRVVSAGRIPGMTHRRNTTMAGTTTRQLKSEPNIVTLDQYIYDEKGQYQTNATGGTHLASASRANQNPTEIVLAVVLRSVPALYRSTSQANQNISGQTANFSDYANECFSLNIDLTLARINLPDNFVQEKRY